MLGEIDLVGRDLPGLIRHESAGPVAVVGDIHGRADLLDRLLRKLHSGTQIVVVGDLCDRGPDTKGVIDLLVERKAVGVRGNHDLWLIQWAQGRGFDRAALAMGGEATLTSYGSVGKDQRQIDVEGPRLVPEHQRRFLESLGLALDLRVAGERYWIVHAGIATSHSYSGLTTEQVVPWLVEHDPASMLWAFVDPEAALPIDAPVIMGHVPRPEPIDLGHVVAVDTGSGRRGGRLTAFVLPERRFVTVG